jgi:hypothetical protein
METALGNNCIMLHSCTGHRVGMGFAAAAAKEQNKVFRVSIMRNLS